MTNFLGTLTANFKQAVISKPFVLAVGIACSLYLAGTSSFFIGSYPNRDVLSIFQYVHDVGLFETMLPICCAIPFGLSFYFDWSSQCISFQVIRSGKKSYIVSKVIACAVSGGLAALVAMIIFVVLMRMTSPLVITTEGVYTSFLSAHEYLLQNPGTPNTLSCLAPILLSGKHISYFIATFYLIFLYCAFGAVIGLCISAAIPNPFVTIFSPFIFLFLSHLLFNNLPSYLDPTSVSKGNFSIVGSPVIHLLYATLYFVLLITILGIVFYNLVNRRIENGFH